MSSAVDVSTNAIFENRLLLSRLEEATDPARLVEFFKKEGNAVPLRVNDGVFSASIVRGVPMFEKDFLGDDNGEKVKERSRSLDNSWVVR
jgi:hypothetical protein